MNGQRSRSLSAPALRLNSGSYSRARSRQTAVDYEQGKDRIAHWIGAWSSEEVGTGPWRFLFNAYFMDRSRNSLAGVHKQVPPLYPSSVPTPSYLC